MSDKVTQTVTQKGSEIEVTVKADQAWLAAAERVYPVVIDPTIEVVPDPAAAQDTMISEGAPTTNYGSSANLNVGNAATGANSYRALLKFDLSQLGLSTSTTVKAASLDVYFAQPHTSEATDVNLEARKVTADWTESTATWSGMNTSYFTGSLPFNYLGVDDEDEGRVQFAGPWAYAAGYANSVAGGLHYLPLGTTADTFTWNPNISDAGNYRVDAYYTAYSNRGTPKYDVVDDTGAKTTTAVNQTTGTSGTGYWATLATKHFSPGKPASVTMTRDTATNSSPVADALRFVEAGTVVKPLKQRDAWHSYAVGNVVQEWVKGTSPNYGLMLKASNEDAGLGGPSYLASENLFGGETVTWPRLTVQYAEPSVELAVPTKINATGAELSWGDYADPSPDDGDDLVEYQVYRGCVTLPESQCTNPVPAALDPAHPGGAELIATEPKDVRAYVDDSATASSTAGPATFRYWIVVRTKDGVLVPSASQLVETPRPGRVRRVLTGDISDTTIANATSPTNYTTTNIPTPDGYNWTYAGNNHTTYGDTRALMAFDTASIPKDVPVLDAELQLWKSASPGSGATFDLHSLTKSFVESQATWNSASSTIPWTTQGGDYSPTVLASSQQANSLPTRLSWKDTKLTDVVQGWITNAGTNHGLLIKARDESVAQQRLAIGAGELSEAELRPRLIVDYIDKTTAGTYYAPEIPERVRPNTIFTVPVTVTNTTKKAWPAMSVSYRWMAGTEDVSVPALQVDTPVNALEPGESVTVPAKIRVAINSTSGNKRVDYGLELELRAGKVWMSSPPPPDGGGLGIPPLTKTMVVEDPSSEQLGLEKFFAYSGEDTGSGSSVVENLYAGNVVFSYDPIQNPSRGASTFVRLSYNSMDGTSTSAGYGWSVQASTLGRLGQLALDTTESSPAGTPPGTVHLVDGDGTSHTWTLNDDGLTYKRPAGVALDLRVDTNATADRKWTLTRPDGTRFYFQDTGSAGAIQTYIRDRNGNQTTFNYAKTVGDTRLLTSITDADGRPTLTLDYFPNSNHLKYVRDYSGRALRFTYVDDQLTQLVDGGKYDPATDTFGDQVTKTFKFGYTTESTNGNAKLTSVVDPRNSTTALQYYASTTDSAAAGKLQTLTDRRGKVTEFAYSDPDADDGKDMQATVTGVSVEGGVTKRYTTSYRMDGYGRPTNVTNAKGEATKLGWDRQNNVVWMEEANGAVSTWVYNQDTGYPTSIRDAEANKNNTPATTLKYTQQPGGTGPNNIPTAPVTVLTEKLSPLGNKWLFSYDTRGNLTSVTDPVGESTATAGDYQTTYDYNSYGQLTQVHDANGNQPTVFADYDANGYPTKITDPLGKSTLFTYDGRGQVSTVTDALGTLTTAQYDSFGRPTKVSTPIDSDAATPLIQTTETKYDLNDNVTTVIAPNGAQTTQTYDLNDQQESSVLPSNGATGERKVTYAYDDLGRLSQQTAPQGNLTPSPDDFVTRYTYDPIGQLTSTVTPFDGRSSYKTTYQYDNVGNLLKVIDPRKNDTPDATDLTKQMSYDRNHRVVATIDAAGYANRSQYDADGRVVVQFDADGNKKTIVYDARGKVSTVSVPHTPTNGTTRQRVVRYSYDENGNQTKAEQPRGVSTTSSATDFLEELVYDANNRVVQRKSPFDAADAIYKTAANTFYQYDAVGNLARQSEPTSATTAATARDWSSFTWFDNGAARTSTDPWGISTTYGLNLLGQQVSRTLTSAAGDATRAMSWEYWDDGSLKSRSDTAPLAGLDEVMVDNSDLQNVAVAIPGTWATANSSATKVGYDYRTHAAASGSTDSFTWKLRVPSSGTYAVYARCPVGVGTATAATYTVQHSTGSATATVNQSACTAQSPWVALGTYTFAEGVDKKVTLAVPATGTVVADAVKLVKAGSGAGAKKDFSYDYDVNGQQTAIHDNSADARIDTYEVRYDGLGRADQIRELKAGVAQTTTTYGYDANSNLTSWFADDQVTPQVDQFAAYTYDVRDMLAKIESAKNPTDTAKKTTTYTYTSRGQRAGIVKPNGNTVAYRWIEDGLMRSQVEKTADGKLVSSHSLTYDLDGNRTSDVSKVKNADSASAYLEQTATLSYTPEGRLGAVTKTGANPGSGESYTYDAPGNVKQQTIAGVTTTYTFDRNRLLQATGGGSTADYNYDPFGRLDTVTVGDKTVERYGYDGFDRMVSNRKYDPATGTQKSSKTSVFDPLDRTVQETTTAAGATKTKVLSYLGLTDQVVSEETPGTGGGAATVSASYTYGPTGERISQTKNPGGTGEETAYYGLNPHTDVETLTDSAGNATSTYRYTGSNDATGFTGKDKATATGGPEVETYNPYRFNSKRWDPATSSYDMGFRDYSPGLNRFLTRDMYNGALADLKLGTDPWNTNRYAFAGGNPITGIEHDGHCAFNPETNDGCGLQVKRTLNSGSNPPPEEQPEVEARPHPDRQVEMAGCSGGPGCVMPEGYVGKYGPYGWKPGERALNDFLMTAWIPIPPFLKALGMLRAARAAEAAEAAGAAARSGPLIELGPGVKSAKALKGLNPSAPEIEYVFEPGTRRFVTGDASSLNLAGSPHEQLARSIGADEGSVVGGTIYRSEGRLVFTENSGHYGHRWTDDTRQQFQDFLKGYGIEYDYRPWG
jgi:RHS repeat-associated protein